MPVWHWPFNCTLFEKATWSSIQYTDPNINMDMHMAKRMFAYGLKNIHLKKEKEKYT